MTSIIGNTSPNVTVASSVALSELPSSSEAVAVTVFTWSVPALPDRLSVNEQL